MAHHLPSHNGPRAATPAGFAIHIPKDIGPRPATQSGPAIHVDIVDGHSLYLAQMRYDAPRHNFEAIRARLAAIRIQKGLPAATKHLAVMATNPQDTRREGFITAIQKSGFEPIELPFWHTYVYGQVTDDSKAERVKSSASVLSYLIGLYAGRAEIMRQKGSLLVVTGDFGVFHAAKDFAERGNDICVAYYRSAIDGRFVDEGLTTDHSRLGWVDLTEWASDLMGVPTASISSKGIINA